MGRLILPLSIAALVGACSRPSEVHLTPEYTGSVEYKQWTRLAVPIIVSIDDQRKTPAGRIGANVSEVEEVPIFEKPAGSSLSMIRQALKKELTKVGFAVLHPGQPPLFTIRFAVTLLWVHEDDSYNGVIEGVVDVTDRSGAILARVPIRGDKTYWDKSLKAEAYQKTLSAAMQELIEELFTSPAFRAAFIQGR